jgi:hypothetical protein
LTAITADGTGKRVMVGGLVDEEQRRFLRETARRNERSISAELRLALRLYQQTETQDGRTIR